MAIHSTKAAVVGAGFIGPVHLEALRRLGIQVTGILGCDLEESKRAQATHGLPRLYESFDDVLNDAEVGSVHLAVPNHLHYEMARQALTAGKHVLCEKPLAMNSRETRELVELANSKNQAAGVCYNVRFYPINLELRARIQRGDFGDIRLINGGYVQDWLFHDTDYNWRVLASQGGELRAVADIGTHWMDLVQSITGLKITRVFADLHTVHPTRKRPKGEVETFTGKQSAPVESETISIDTEDYGAVLLHFDNGARGCLNVSQVTAGRKNCIRYEIAGAKASAAWNSESPNDLWIGHRNHENQELIRNAALFDESVRRFANYPAGHNEGFPDTFKQLFRSFYEYIDNGDFTATPGFPTFEQGHHEVELCEAILTSHRKQRWVEL